MKHLKTIPKGWKIKKISDLLNYERPDKYIVKNTAYSDQYKIPVLTANKSFILGYTDEDFGIYNDVPVIIFDDFTTDSKYVDFPFKIKSSAIKILKAKNKNVNLKFVYEKMKSIKFPTGNHKRYYISEYQNLKIAVPQIKEQQKIADILSAVDEDIEKTDRVIEKTKKLKKGLMQKFFSKKLKVKSEKLEKICNFSTGRLNSNQAVADGQYPFFTCSQETYKIDRYSFDQEAVLLAGNNAAGIYSVKYYEGKFDAYQRTYVITSKNKEILDYFYLKQILQTKLEELKNKSFGSSTKFLTLKLLKNLQIILPSINKQKQIAKILSKVDDKIGINKQIKNKLAQLKKGLMQDLLKGRVRV